RSHAGRSRKERRRWSTAPRSRRRPSAAPNGWWAKSSPTAARRSCSSRRNCAAASRGAPASSRASCVRRAPGPSSLARSRPLERPGGVLGEQLVVVRGVSLDPLALLVTPHVAERDQRVPLQPARLVARHVEAVVLLDYRAAVVDEPADEIDVPASVL